MSRTHKRTGPHGKLLLDMGIVDAAGRVRHGYKDPWVKLKKGQKEVKQRLHALVRRQGKKAATETNYD